MASRAYRPDQTLTPFQGWARPRPSSWLQADLLLRSSDGGNELIESHSIQRVPEQVHVSDWAERFTFKTHYARWIEDSMFDSLPDRMTRHESYRAIVAQGDRVVPLIAAELRKSPSYIFLALEEITGSDPVPDEAQGDLRATTAAWLTWLQR